VTAILVLTVLAADRPGIVKELSEAVTAHRGNWLESRMARLAGQFAGILRVECPADRAEALGSAIETLPGLAVQIRREESSGEGPRRTVVVDVVGNDRPGIVRDLSLAILDAGANIEELQTTMESAPMAGHLLFRAHGLVSLPEELASETLREAIEKLGADLAVTVEA